MNNRSAPGADPAFAQDTRQLSSFFRVDGRIFMRHAHYVMHIAAEMAETNRTIAAEDAIPVPLPRHRPLKFAAQFSFLFHVDRHQMISFSQSISNTLLTNN